MTLAVALTLGRLCDPAPSSIDRIAILPAYAAPRGARRTTPRHYHRVSRRTIWRVSSGMVSPTSTALSPGTASCPFSFVPFPLPPSTYTCTCTLASPRPSPPSPPTPTPPSLEPLLRKRAVPLNFGCASSGRKRSVAWKDSTMITSLRGPQSLSPSNNSEYPRRLH